MKSIKTWVYLILMLLAVASVVYYQQKIYQKPAVIKVEKPVAVDKSPILEGRELFSVNCTPCHRINTKLVGPPLGPVAAIRDRKWFIKFTQNWQALYKAGDPLTKQVTDYDPSAMQLFPNLTDQQVGNIIDYIKSCGLKDR